MALDTNSFGKSYNSFSGVDIKAVFGSNVIAEIQAVSYSITREKAPLYTMGAADPRSFSRGKRGIAGTLVFLMFDRHALLFSMGFQRFMSDVDDFRPRDLQDQLEAQSAIQSLSSLSQTSGLGAGLVESQLGQGIDTDQEVIAPWFTDQLLPFDITLAAANEYGRLAVMRIYGCEILNEGYGISIDDIVSEQQMSYVARTLSPWRPVTSAKTDEIYGEGQGQETQSAPTE